MRVLVVDNYAGSQLGLVGTALDEAGAILDRRAPWRGEPLPDDPAGHDALVVMGGPQSALDDADHPYLPRAAALARAFAAADKAVLGVCLGSQVIARGLGATNILGRPIEFGWAEVTPTPAGRDDPMVAALGTGAPIFHWHTDTYTLPPGAVRLASSDLTAVQAYRVGARVYGIQFHFEASRAVVDDWTVEWADWFSAHMPDWPERRGAEAERHGATADRVGLDLARRWVRLARS